MPDDPVATVRRATHAELPDVARVLGDAFRDEPWTRWTVDAIDHRARVEALQLLALEHVGFPHGEVWVAEVDGTLACAAVWMRSDRPVPDAAWAATVRRQRELAGDRHDAAVAAQDAVVACRPIEAHVYLATIGTARAHARRGLASALLRAGLARADDDSLPVFLETSTETNVAFYTSFGFVVVDELALGDGPMVWIMRRAPASPGDPQEAAHARLR